MRDTIELARQVGYPIQHEEWRKAAEEFAALVAQEATEEANRRANASWTLMCEKMVAAEREACAKVCDVHTEGWQINPGQNPLAGFIAASNCATAIRARGNT
jgi:hypothetical protein